MNLTSSNDEYQTVEGSVAELLMYAIVGGYALTSLLLLRFPYMLHKKKKIQFDAAMISHRGGSAEGIENTIGNYENAIKAGTEMLEMDCQLTLDGEVVVVHDLNLSNLCDTPVFVKDVTYQNLPKYKSRLSVTFDKDHVTEAGPNTDRRIPLLREVFEKFPDTPMNIDIKAHNDELICKVSDLVREFKREGITVLGSFSSEVSRKCQLMNPAVPHFCSFHRVIKIGVSFYLGLLPFLSISESFFEIMMPSIGYDKNNCMKVTKFGKVMLRIMDFLIMNRFLFRHLQRRGMKVYVWVLNHEDQYERALAYGVDGIMTDFPTKLTSYMNNRSHRNHRTDASAAKCEKGA